MITRRGANIGLLASAAMAAAGGLASAQELQALDLPPPQSEGGKPVIEAVRLRRSIRNIRPPASGGASSVRSLVGRPSASIDRRAEIGPPRIGGMSW